MHTHMHTDETASKQNYYDEASLTVKPGRFHQWLSFNIAVRDPEAIILPYTKWNADLLRNWNSGLKSHWEERIEVKYTKI